MTEQKNISDIKVEKRVYSAKNNKWMLRGRDKITNKLGILVCISDEKDEPYPEGKWLIMED
jgi:hypothetical protein